MTCTINVYTTTALDTQQRVKDDDECRSTVVFGYFIPDNTEHTLCSWDCAVFIRNCNFITKVLLRSFENGAKFDYFKTTVINQNLIQEEIKSRENSGMLAAIHFRLACLLTHYPKNIGITTNTL